MSRNLIIAIILLVALGAAIYLLFSRQTDVVTMNTESASTSSQQSQPLTTPPTQPSPAATSLPNPAKDTQDQCRTGYPLTGVYHTYRLKLLKPCQTITGIVEKINTEEADGYYHIDVRLDSEYANLLIPGNSQQGGDLVVEIICVKPSTLDYVQKACSGYQKPDVPFPAIGTYIEVTGPYVNDTKHNWAEIHPVWELIVK